MNAKPSNARTPDWDIDSMFVDRWSPRAFLSNPLTEREIQPLIQSNEACFLHLRERMAVSTDFGKAFFHGPESKTLTLRGFLKLKGMKNEGERC